MATLTGSGSLNFSTIFLLESGEKGFVGGRDMSKIAAAFLGMSVLGRSKRVVVFEALLFRLFGRRNEDLRE